MSEVLITSVKDYLQNLQDKICQTIETVDGEVKFKQDIWQHKIGGGGRSRVLTRGRVFEQAGVNFSHVTGKTLPKAATNKRPELEGATFEAMGVSLVFHPNNPFMPTTHTNVRFITANKPGQEPS